MKQSAWIGLLILFGWVGCQFRGFGGSSPSVVGRETIRIGEVGSMTGSDATFGVSTHQGILLAVEELNQNGGVAGKKVELVSLDDQGQASEAVLAVQKLVTQSDVRAILGEVASTISLAMAPVAQQLQVPLISPSSIHSKLTEVGDFIFRVCFVDRFQSKVMAQFALNHIRAKKVAILEDVKSDYSRDSARIFSDHFIRGGGKVVISQSYAAGDLDFRAQLTAIRATDPDVILVPGYYTEIGLIARQKVELGLKAPLLGGDGWDSPKLTEIGGSALVGSFFVSHFSQEHPTVLVQKFVESYRAHYRGASPDGLAALGYDAARLLGEALKKTSGRGGQELRKVLASIRDFSGVTGRITLGPDRNAVKSAVVFEIGAGGKLKSAAWMSPDSFY